MQFKLVEDIDTQYLDSAGNILSVNQSKYFIDSKARDFEGNLYYYITAQNTHLIHLEKMILYGYQKIMTMQNPMVIML